MKTKTQPKVAAAPTKSRFFWHIIWDDCTASNWSVKEWTYNQVIRLKHASRVNLVVR